MLAGSYDESHWSLFYIQASILEATLVMDHLERLGRNADLAETRLKILAEIDEAYKKELAKFE